MNQAVLDEVAYLFVEQYENIHGLYSESYKKTDVDLIRRTAEIGEAALYKVATAVFADQLDPVLKEAAYNAMDYIAYVDETWMPADAADKERTLETEAIHLEALKVLLQMAEGNERGVIEKIKGESR